MYLVNFKEVTKFYSSTVTCYFTPLLNKSGNN